jgi:hypothetical protein
MRKYMVVALMAVVGIELICRVMFFGPQHWRSENADPMWKVVMPEPLIPKSEKRARMTAVDLSRLSSAFRLTTLYSMAGYRLIGDLEPNRDYLNVINRDHPFRVVTNSSGLRRKRQVDVRADTEPRILVLGDSFTFGPYVSNSETFTSVAERKLFERFSRPIEVLNAGVSGYHLTHQLALYEERGHLSQSQVVVVQVLDNDLLGYVDSPFVRPDPIETFKLLSNNWIFKISYWVKSRSDTVGVFFALTRLAELPALRELASYIRREIILPVEEQSKNDAPDLTENHGRDIRVVPFWTDEKHSARLDKGKAQNNSDFKALVEAIRGNTATAILLYFPTQWTLKVRQETGTDPVDSYYRQLAIENRVTYLSLSDAYMGHPNPEQLFLYPWNGHPNVFGYQLAGEQLGRIVAQVLCEQPSLRLLQCNP